MTWEHFSPGLAEGDVLKLTWKPKKGPIKTTVLLKGGYMGFHVGLGECKSNIKSLKSSRVDEVSPESYI